MTKPRIWNIFQLSAIFIYIYIIFDSGELLNKMHADLNIYHVLRLIDKWQYFEILSKNILHS